MSTYYPDLPSTSFPDALDAIPRMSDITADDLPNVAEYEQLMAAGDRAGAAAVLAAHPELVNKIFNAEKFNQNRDAILAIQRMWNEDISQYLVDIVKHRGNFDTTARYTKYDVVQYSESGGSETYMCIAVNTPIGTEPTNTSYWVGLTLRGDKGEPGIGLTSYGAWESSTNYPKDAMVSYDNQLWQSTTANPSGTPGSSSDWISIFNVSDVLPLVIFQGDEEEIEQELPVNADTLSGQNRSYYENIGSRFTASCTYSNKVFSLIADENIVPSKEIFHITFKAPADYTQGALFIFDGNYYTTSRVNFTASEVVELIFERSRGVCTPAIIRPRTNTFTLKKDGWSNSSQIVKMYGVTDNSILFVSPAPESMAAYCEAVVYANKQSVNTVYFTCSETPESDLQVIITYGGETYANS